MLSRVIYGARTSLAIGFGAALVAMAIGVPVGLVAGYLRGAVDVAVAAIIDLFIALPGLVLALIITVMVGPTSAQPDPGARVRDVAADRAAGARTGAGDPRDAVRRSRARHRRRQLLDHPPPCLAERDAQSSRRNSRSPCHLRSSPRPA